MHASPKDETEISPQKRAGNPQPTWRLVLRSGVHRELADMTEEDQQQEVDRRRACHGQVRDGQLAWRWRFHTLRRGGAMSDGREEREELEKRREQEEREDREDRIDRGDVDPREPERVDS
jgi:hypothetical protein